MLAMFSAFRFLSGRSDQADFKSNKRTQSVECPHWQTTLAGQKPAESALVDPRLPRDFGWRNATLSDDVAQLVTERSWVLWHAAEYGRLLTLCQLHTFRQSQH